MVTLRYFPLLSYKSISHPAPLTEGGGVSPSPQREGGLVAKQPGAGAKGWGAGGGGAKPGCFITK